MESEYAHVALPAYLSITAELGNTIIRNDQIERSVPLMVRS